jgi:hypothetical protein
VFDENTYFRLPDDRHVRIRGASKGGGEAVVRERTDRDRCPIPEHRVGAW